MLSRYPGNFGLGPLRFPEADAASDPLAGIPFVVRWQSYAGGAPIGYYLDEACTIPAVTEFDLVVAIKDELSGSGLVAVQTNPDRQAMLVFVNGVPGLYFDGVDDLYIHTATLTAPCSIFAVCKNEGGGGANTVAMFDSQDLPLYSSIAGSWGTWAATVVNSGVANTTVQVLHMEVEAPNNITFYTDGVPVNKTNGTAFDVFGSSAIGSEGSVPSNPFGGYLFALFAIEEPADLALIRDSLQTIYDDVLGS
jgi:hypothetical protein